MTAARSGSGHGRGGQGGHEPPAQVQAREHRVLERSLAGLSQREIAAEEGITQGAVSKILQRVEARLFKEFVARVEQAKARQGMSLQFIFQEGMKAWQASQGRRDPPRAAEDATSRRRLGHDGRPARRREPARRPEVPRDRAQGLGRPAPRVGSRCATQGRRARESGPL